MSWAGRFTAPTFAFDQVLVRVVRGRSFYVTYKTSAIRYSHFVLSNGLTQLGESEVVVPNNLPGGSPTWRMRIRVDRAAPPYATLVEVVKTPTGELAQVRTLVVDTAPAPARWKLEPAASDEPISLVSHGFLDGTRVSRHFQRDRRMQTYRFYDAITGRDAPVDSDDATLLRRLLNSYVLSGALHEHTEADDPPCCDRGIERVYFDKYAAEPSAVPQLVQLFEKYTQAK